VNDVSLAKRAQIARWLYSKALRDVRADSNARTWAALLRAAQSLRYAIDCVEKAAADEARRKQP
jgi:hypothetical protein